MITPKRAIRIPPRTPVRPAGRRRCHIVGDLTATGIRRPPEEAPIPAERCETCNRPRAICVCDKVHPLAVTTPVLILQHPAEPDEVLGTAQILAASLPNCRVRTGLSWPNLAAAWGEPASGSWAVLWKGGAPDAAAPIAMYDRHDKPLPVTTRFAGLIVLDGSWSQAKSLWWRNAWLNRLDRIVLQPKEAGIYGKVRKEPNRFAVSTLEAVAEALVANGEPAEARDELRRWMRTMVQRARDTHPGRKDGPSRAQAPGPATDEA